MTSGVHVYRCTINPPNNLPSSCDQMINYNTLYRWSAQQRLDLHLDNYDRMAKKCYIVLPDFGLAEQYCEHSS